LVDTEDGHLGALLEGVVVVVSGLTYTARAVLREEVRVILDFQDAFEAEVHLLAVADRFLLHKHAVTQRYLTAPSLAQLVSPDFENRQGLVQGVGWAALVFLFLDAKELVVLPHDFEFLFSLFLDFLHFERLVLFLVQNSEVELGLILAQLIDDRRSL